MGKIDFVKAYFIKLGEKGLWEKSSIEEGKIRIGYDHQTLDDINKQKWVVIRKKIKPNFFERVNINKRLE